jgi:alanyl-tRNA synthetase
VIKSLKKENELATKQTTMRAKQISAEIKGGGGVNKTLATAGGSDVDGMQKALEKVKGTL